ncbi:MAG: hypothetical protein ACFFEO_00200 [Candidatus Thorarchaeota archaeon]
MEQSNNEITGESNVKVIHDLKRQILEIPSLIRVMNRYYREKLWPKNQIKPYLLKNSPDWLPLTSDLTYRKDSSKFPNSIILFEAWMNLGFDALYPKFALHYKFPGILKGEKVRHLFQFTFSTSRGFGFPIYFGPEFYGYILTYGKILEPILKWSHTVCHRANQAIFLIAKRYNLKQHHPGEFESIIISEYKNNTYKGVDTLLHGYFTKDPKDLGSFKSLNEALRDIYFSYSIGDHSMSIELSPPKSSLHVSLIPYHKVKENYNINFYIYIKKLISFRKTLIHKILTCKTEKKILKSRLSRIKKLKLYFNRSKKFKSSILESSKNIFEIEKFNLYIHVIEKILELLWTTPLYTHTQHILTTEEMKFFIQENNLEKDFKKKSTNSIFLLCLRYYEKKYRFDFEEEEIINKINELENFMGKMWFDFKDNHFDLALKELNQLFSCSIDDQNYNMKVSKVIDELIPIFSIYEIFNRPLSETVYPESIPRTKRPGAYIASFLTSKYNPFGVNLMHLFNKLAFYNWGYFILHNKLNRRNFYEFILKLPIWKYIPQIIKLKILKQSI